MTLSAMLCEDEDGYAIERVGGIPRNMLWAPGVEEKKRHVVGSA
jgi:hypothetical protein